MAVAIASTASTIGVLCSRPAGFCLAKSRRLSTIALQRCVAADGVKVRAAHWATSGDRGTIFVFPGRTEYIEKYGKDADELLSRGLATLVIDWRGQGLADRLIDNTDLGHVGQFTDYQRDVAAMVELRSVMGEDGEVR